MLFLVPLYYQLKYFLVYKYNMDYVTFNLIDFIMINFIIVNFLELIMLEGKKECVLNDISVIKQEFNSLKSIFWKEVNLLFLYMFH